MDEKQEQINKMLSIIMESSHQMPNCVFDYYCRHNKNAEEKIFYDLVADSFLTLFSYCKLVFENAWSQAFALLRVGIEQISAAYLLSTNEKALHEYIELHKLETKYVNLGSQAEKEKLLSDHSIKKNKVHSFFDYGWISNFTDNRQYGRNEIIKLAGLGEFIVDIDETLNAFAHGSLSVFQMNKDNWNLMRRYVNRSSLICCKLYDFLCCAYLKLIGPEEFFKLPLNKYFISFKTIYCAFIKRRKAMAD